MAHIKTLTPNVGKEAKELEPLSIVGGDTEWYNQLVQQFRKFSERQIYTNLTTQWFS